MRLANRSEKEYFATLEDEEELAAEVWDRVSDFYVRMRGRLYYQRAIESFRMYYGLRTADNPFDVTTIAASGPTSSHSQIKVNHYYSLGQSLVSMATSNRPDWVAIPSNSDSRSLQNKILAQQLLDYYMRETGLEIKMRGAVESAVSMQDGYLLLTWDPAAGRMVTPEIPADPETGEGGMGATYAGDVVARSLTPFDMVDDLDWRGSGERPWRITREFVNKWDLAEQYPNYRDEILNAWYNPESEGQEPTYMAGTSFGEDFRPNRDQVVTFTLWHRKTKACPGGIMAVVLNDRVCLFRGGLPYGDHLPIHHVAPAIMAGSTLGHTPMINIISVQKAISAAWSAPITNLSLYGTGAMLVPKGAGLNVSDLGGGAFAMEYDGDKEPKPLNVPGIQEPAMRMAEALVTTAGQMVAVPDIMRGQTPPQSSGALQALTMQTAVQYSSGLMQGVVKFQESIGDALIKILQTYAKTPRLATIVGKSKAPMLREFSSDDISNVASVTVQVGNPMSKTPGGRQAIADNLLDKGLLTAQEYIDVANNGTLETVLNAPITQKALIAQENEALAAARELNPEEAQALQMGAPGAQGAVVAGPGGQPLFLNDVPVALATDNHAWHIPEHATVLDSPQMRGNHAVIAAVMHHIGEHKYLQGLPDGGMPPVLPPGTPPPNMNPNPPPPPAVDPNANGGGPGPDGNAPPPAPKAPGPGGAAGPNLPQQPKPAESPLAGQSPVGKS